MAAVTPMPAKGLGGIERHRSGRPAKLVRQFPATVRRFLIVHCPNISMWFGFLVINASSGGGRLPRALGSALASVA